MSAVGALRIIAMRVNLTVSYCFFTKDNKSIVVENNAEVTSVDQIMWVDEEGCLVCPRNIEKVSCDGVVFISQITWA